MHSQVATKEMTFYRICWWLAYGLSCLLFRLRTEGREHVGTNGGVIFAGNHCSYADPVFIGVAAGRELWYVTKRESFTVPILGWLLRNLNAIPVDRSRGDRGAIMAFESQLKVGEGVMMFPEGTRSRNGEFQSPKSGVGMVAYRTGVPVIPVYISGTVNVWKSLIGLERVTVRFGSPIHICPDKLPAKRRAAYDSISKEVMEEISVLKQSHRNAGTMAPASRL